MIDVEHTPTQPAAATPTENVTVTLAGSEVTAFGEQLLSDLSSAAECLHRAVPTDWVDWTRGEGTGAFDEVADLVAKLRQLERAAEEREPVDLTVDRAWLRQRLRAGVQGNREQMAAAVGGGYLPHVDSVAIYETGAKHYAALVAILDRVGWGDESPSDLETLRRFAAALS